MLPPQPATLQGKAQYVCDPGSIFNSFASACAPEACDAAESSAQWTCSGGGGSTRPDTFVVTQSIALIGLTKISYTEAASVPATYFKHILTDNGGPAPGLDTEQRNVEVNQLDLQPGQMVGIKGAALAYTCV